MELIGQCKIDFGKWFITTFVKEFPSENTEGLLIKTPELVLSNFYISPFSMQYGVYVDWFDSVGIYILEGYYPFLFGGHTYAFSIREKSKKYSIDESFNSRYESRTEAIKKVNEIYNSTQ